MATTQELKFIINAEDNASRTIAGLQNNLKSLEPQFKQMAVVGAAGFAALSVAIGASVKETLEAQSATNRLTQILKTSRGATDEQVKSLLDQADALEKVGVIQSDSIVQAQAQLATFDLEAESIERLTPAILDYVVAEKGASATTEDLKQLTNGLAQALQGNFSSLTRTGFVLDDATKALIENGTEAERTAALVSVLNSTYKGFNESARETAEGTLINLRNQFDNLKESIGTAFLPVLLQLVEAVTPFIEKLGEWVQKNPELTQQIIIAVGVLFGLAAVIGTVGLALIAFNPIAAGIVLAIAGIILVIRNLNEIIKIFQSDWTLVWEGIKLITKDIINSIIGFAEGLANSVIKAINKIINAFNNLAGIPGFKKLSIPTVPELNIPRLAEGGIVTKPTLALIGEAGPEAVVPLRNNNGGMSGATIIITGNTFMSDREAAEMIGDQIIKRLGLSTKLLPI